MESGKIYPMRLQATSIVESITAMVIILLSFGVGMMIYMNVLRSEHLISKTSAYVILSQALNKTIQKEEFDDAKFQEGGLWIVRTFKKHSTYQDIYTVQLEAFDAKGKSILILKELIFQEKK